MAKNSKKNEEKVVVDNEVKTTKPTQIEQTVKNEVVGVKVDKEPEVEEVGLKEIIESVKVLVHDLEGIYIGGIAARSLERVKILLKQF